MVEAAAGAPKLFAASIPTGKTGPQVGDVCSQLTSIRFAKYRMLLLLVTTYLETFMDHTVSRVMPRHCIAQLDSSTVRRMNFMRPLPLYGRIQTAAVPRS